MGEKSVAERFAIAKICDRGGCSSKLSGESLTHLLSLVAGDDGVRPFDDAADLSCSCGDEVVVTVDFAPPAHPDGYTAGVIAALNSLSDLYAAGAVPRASLAIYTVDTSAPWTLTADLLRGLTNTAAVEGAGVIGGHTTTGSEFVLGLAAFGRAARRVRKRGARIGDHIFVSKPLGTNAVLWGHALGLCNGDDLASATAIMATSNRAASEAMVAAAASACTDITGFGFLGSLSEMLDGTLGARITLSAVPIHEAARKLQESVLRTASVGANRRYVSMRTQIETAMPEPALLTLYDAQTNGGLLVTAASGSSDYLTSRGYVSIGTIVAGNNIEVL